MDNEPVAWMLLRDESCVELTEWFGVMRGWEDFLGDNEKIVELYANPVDDVNTSEQYVDKSQKNRHELTDEEEAYKDLYINAIKQLNKMLDIPNDGDIRFKWIAVELSERLDELAILRKAQEK